MNRLNEKTFLDLRAAAGTFRTAIEKACLEYRQEKEKSTRYKDDIAEQYILNARNRARQDIQVARDDFSAEANAQIKNLRDELSRSLLLRPNTVLVEEVQLFSNFGLKPTKLEVEALRDMNNANILGGKIINAMLEKTGSNWRLDTSATEAFEKDLKDLSTWANADVLYVPENYIHEISEIMTGAPHLINNADGSLVDMGRTWDFNDMLITSSIFKAVVDDMVAMSERWTGDIIPTLYQENLYPDKVNPETGEEISGTEQFVADHAAAGKNASVTPKFTPGEALAKQMGKDEAERTATAKAVVERYAAGAGVAKL